MSTDANHRYLTSVHTPSDDEITRLRARVEELAVEADVLPAHCSDPEALKVLHSIRDQLLALTGQEEDDG